MTDTTTRLMDQLGGLGARRVDPPILQSADTLLDLYGEDIRARAYVTQDPLRGEQMLRPDFTVPVVQMHMSDGGSPARYAYAGVVFRRQEEDPDRANEYVQVGYEVFDPADPIAVDAEVFAVFADMLTGLPLRRAIGDIGILAAAVRGLNTTDARKAALMRHLWRPRRFRALIERYASQDRLSEERAALLQADDPFADAPPQIGKRSLGDIQARLDALRAEAAVDPLSQGEVTLVQELLSVRETAPNALSHLRDLAMDLPAIEGAVDGLRKRLDAIADRGIDMDTLAFEASYGRTSMEYYDGFVFGFHSEGRPDLPPVASGGRYDALTARLGQGRAIPAVGGVVRPDLIDILEADA